MNSQLWITTWQDDDFGHGFSYFVYTCGGENSTNESHFPAFSKDVAFAHFFVAPQTSPTFPPYKSASSIGYVSKNGGKFS